MPTAPPIASPAAPADAARTGVRVLVADADPASRGVLVGALTCDMRVRVVSEAGTAAAVLAGLKTHRPDVVLIADGSSGLDAFEITRNIMETQPLPIVLCVAPAEAGGAVFRSMEAGAVACVDKPGPAMQPAEREAAAVRLRQTVRLMAEVKVVRRWSPARSAVSQATRAPLKPGPRVVGIGASTGGPLVLQTLLAELPADFELPILVVQHIARGFLPGMADWLRQTSGMKVLIAASGLMPQPGHVYLAPDDLHLGLDATGRILLTRGAPESGLRPAVACLFRSLAQVHGRDAIGVLLSGMGKDGAADLKRLKDLGATTIAQDSASSVVHGMPGEAIALGAASHVLPGDRIAQMLVTLARRGAVRKEAA